MIEKQYKKLRVAGLMLVCMMLFSAVIGQQAQQGRRARQTVDVTIKVADESGAPVAGANVTVGEGIVHVMTDANGSVTFRAYPDDFVTISSPSYEKSVLLVTDLVQSSTVTLIQGKLYMTTEDDVPLPFATLKKRNITGPEVTVEASRLASYPTNDIRNTLTGLTSGLDVRELYGWPGISAQEAVGQFGATDKFSNVPVAIVDGIYTDLSEMPLDFAEIESITINKGILSNAMFGPVAGNGGSIYIKTKRGAKNERLLDINLETGVSVVDRMPGYVQGGDYARLNNIARTADGLAALYDNADIAAYDMNNPYDKYHPSIDFYDMIFKSSMPYRKAGVSSSGGNDIVQYYSYVGYNGQGDIYKIGAESNYNKLSTRQNVDVKVNDALSVNFSFYGNIITRKSPNYGYDVDFTSENTSSNPVLGNIEMPAVLDDVRSVPPVAFPVYALEDDGSGIPWYGVSSNYTNNPVAGMLAQGYYDETGRLGASSIALNFDLGKLVDGLKSTTFVGFNIYNLVRRGQADDYMAYIATPGVSAATGNDTILLTKSSSHNLVNQTEMAKLMDYYFQRYAFYESLEYNKKFGENSLQANLTYYLGKTFKNGIEEPERQQNLILHSMYSWRDKLSAELVLNYSGTYSFDKDNRYKLFPSGGLSYVVTESNSGAVNYVKVRGQAGMIGVEKFTSPFYYITRLSQNTSGSAFGPISTNTWFGTTTDASVPRTNPQRIGNPDLGWEVYKEINLGFDALMLDKKLYLEMTYMHYMDDGSILQVSNVLPYAAGLTGARPYYNYTQLKGDYLLSDLSFTQSFGDVTLTLGANATTGVEKRVKYDEPNYRNDYQKRTGKASDAIFGMTYLGKFASDAETTVVPQLFDAELKAGDLKYADLDGDGLVDDNDQSMIGHSAPRLYYGINARLRYKNFEFFVHGAGRAFYDLALTNAYYWNGWGDNNYSEFVRDNVGEAYPRLTYYRVNNNFITSDFWLTKGGYFKIQNVELAYTIPAKAVQFMGSQGVRLYVRGANLLTLSQVKDVDPESINSGVENYPLFKTFTGGVKINF